MAISSSHLSEEELIDQLEKAAKLIEIGSIYRHYRDPQNQYKVIGLSIIEATQEVGILYKKETGSDNLRSVLWVRPISAWLEKVLYQEALVSRFQKK